jgi:hypothetical protein
MNRRAFFAITVVTPMAALCGVRVATATRATDPFGAYGDMILRGVAAGVGVDHAVLVRDFNHPGWRNVPDSAALYQRGRAR